MRVPSIKEAERLLTETEKINEGLWIDHNKTAGYCVKVIASHCDNLDEK